MGTITTNRELINTDSITSIEIRPKRINFNYHWREQFKLFGFILLHNAGFYNRMDEWVDVSKFDDDDNYYVEGKWVFFNPHIVLNLNDRSERTIYFKSVDLMEGYIKQFENKNINFFYL